MGPFLNDANGVVQSTIALARIISSVALLSGALDAQACEARLNFRRGAPLLGAERPPLRERRAPQEARMSLPLAWAEEIGSVA
jgi:hypothetical protein